MTYLVTESHVVLAKVEAHDLRKIRVHHVPDHAPLDTVRVGRVQGLGQRVRHSRERRVDEGRGPVVGARPVATIVLPEFALHDGQGAVGELQDSRVDDVGPAVGSADAIIDEGGWDVGLAVMPVEYGFLEDGAVAGFGALGQGARATEPEGEEIEQR